MTVNELRELANNTDQDFYGDVYSLPRAQLVEAMAKALTKYVRVQKGINQKVLDYDSDVAKVDLIQLAQIYDTPLTVEEMNRATSSTLDSFFEHDGALDAIISDTAAPKFFAAVRSKMTALETKK